MLSVFLGREVIHKALHCIFLTNNRRPQLKKLLKNVYAKMKEECEILLAELIKEMKAEIQAEKERLKQEQSM